MESFNNSQLSKYVQRALKDQLNVETCKKNELQEITFHIFVLLVKCPWKTLKTPPSIELYLKLLKQNHNVILPSIRYVFMVIFMIIFIFTTDCDFSII